MNIKQAKEEIKHTVAAYLSKDESGAYRIPPIRQRPILLMGPPGIGKTQIMEQIARECRIGLVSYTITHHTRQSAVGLPYIKEKIYDEKTYSVTEYTMSEIIASIHEKKKATGLKEGILFIDEINCVSETLAPTMLQFLQCKTFGNQPVPEGWIIAAAGNPPEYNKSVRDFDMVTLDRVRCIQLEADFSVWKEYARNVPVHRAILSYLDLKPKNFYRVEADVDGLQFVTARGWEDLSSLMYIYEELKIPINEWIIYEFLHHMDTAQDVAAYFDLYNKYQDDYGISQILSGQIPPGVYARIHQAAFDERLSVVNLLSDGLSNYFIQYGAQSERTELWYAFLKDYREHLLDDSNPLQCYGQLLQYHADSFEQERKGNLLTARQIKNREWLFEQLKNAAPAPDLSPQQAFLAAKETFSQQRKTLEQTEQETDLALANAFDFMEHAFSCGQEMVVFVTDLTIGQESSAFLTEHPCDRYTKYMEQLLIGTRREQLLLELARDEAQPGF